MGLMAMGPPGGGPRRRASACRPPAAGRVSPGWGGSGSRWSGAITSSPSSVGSRGGGIARPAGSSAGSNWRPASSSSDRVLSGSPYTNDTATKITARTGYYDYQDRHPGQSSAFWVDFANHFLGGGVFSTGFVQEEVMFLETPELANAAATKKIDTRVPNDPNNTSAVAGPLEGSPEPWVFTDVQRTMSINTADLGPFKDASVARVDQYSTALPASQTFNVLAMAAPKLDNP